MSNLKVGIVGAGIQGISNALFLQKKGFEVTVFDKKMNLVVQLHLMEMLVIFLRMLHYH